MSDLTLLILRIGLLLVLWAFIFAIVYALRSDLFGAPVRKLKGDTGPHVQPIVSPSPAGQAPVAAAPIMAAAASPGAATGLALTGPLGAPTAPAAGSPGFPGGPVVTPSGGALPSAGGSGAPKNLVITTGVAAGTSIPLDEHIFTIGRSSDSTLVIVDEYTSTYHARLALTGGEWILTDLDSTNGTRLDGARVTKPVPVPPFTPVTIGTTTFELRP
ncbi:FHA domain-containing protein FhaB/FipA [Leucobacter sp. HY1908]